MTDEQLRELYPRALDTRRDPRRIACPSPDELLALAQGSSHAPERMEALDHVMSCPDCRQDFALLRAIERGRRAETGEATRRIRWPRPMGAALVTGLAAALAFAAVLGPRHDWWRSDASDVVRGASRDVVPLAPAADAVVPRGPLAFAWRPVPGARGYTLEVLSPDGSTLASRQTTDTTATLTDRRIVPGDYRWWVRARLDGGERRSTARRLRVGG